MKRGGLIGPTLPLNIEATALALTYAALNLGEDADIFRRDPIPEHYDTLLQAMRDAKAMIARAEEIWGV